MSGQNTSTATAIGGDASGTAAGANVSTGVQTATGAGGGQGASTGSAAQGGPPASGTSAAGTGTQAAGETGAATGGTGTATGGTQRQPAAGDAGVAGAGAAAELELKLPDGFKADDARVTAFKATAKELGLDSAKAQKLFDLYATQQAESLKVAEAEGQKLHQGWLDAQKGDAEIGGEKLPASINNARRAIAKYGTPELRAFLNDTGVGDHPELLRFVSRVGAAMREDSVGGTAAAAGSTNDAATKLRNLYPNSPGLFGE